MAVTLPRGVERAFPGVLLLLLAAVPLKAQPAGELLSEGAAASWMTAWSPFTLGPNLPRTPGRPQRGPNLLLAPPRIGLFWTGGNPGALPFEVEDRWSDFRATTTDTSGEYRRPLDPERGRVSSLSGLGWRTLDERGAVVGRVTTERRESMGSPAVSLRPYGSSPFTAVDTAKADVFHMRTRLEGAGGWRLGRFGLGLAAGHEAHDHRTRATGLPRVGRAAAPAVAAGAVAAFDDGTRVGAYGRWSRFAETTNVEAVSVAGLIYGIDGYREPTSHGVGAATGPYFLRMEHDARAAGVNAGGVWHGLSWTVFVESGRLTQARWNDGSEDSPPKDRWSADAVAAGAAAQRSLAGVFWTVNLRWTTLSGEASLATADGPEFTAEEGAVAGSVEARLRPEGLAWSAAARAGLAYETRIRTDAAAELSTELETLTPFLAATVGWALAEATLVSAGLNWTSHLTRGSIPLAGGEGPGYQRVLAPEIALLASPAASWTMSLGFGHRIRDGTFVWVQGERAALSPADAPRTLPLRPSGDRTATHLAVGVTLTP